MRRPPVLLDHHTPSSGLQQSPIEAYIENASHRPRGFDERTGEIVPQPLLSADGNRSSWVHAPRAAWLSAHVRR